MRNALANLIVVVVFSLTGCTPSLLKAVRTGDVASTAVLLEKGADPNARGGDYGAQTPLLVAAAQGQLQIVKILVERGARINEAGHRGETSLMLASGHGRLDVVQYLLHHGADIGAKGVQGTTALHEAAEHDQPEIAQVLLDHGADVNAPDSMTLGRTPLGIAAYFGNARMARLLLERGADPRIPGENGRIPEQQARWNGHFELARLLKEFVEGKPLPPAAEPAASPEASSSVDKPAYQLAENSEAFAVVVGVRRSSGLPEKAFAERDAEAVRAHLLALGYPAAHVILLTGLQASRAGLAKNLESRLPAMADERSTVLFYFSGAAATDTKTGKSYLLPTDGDPDYLSDTGYPVARLFESLSVLKSRRIVAVLECGLEGEVPRAAGKLVALLASRPGQEAGTMADQGHGAFTYFFLRGLNGGAKGTDGTVTVRSIYAYLRDNVLDAAKKLGRVQEPQIIGEDSPRAGLRLR